MVRVRVRVDRWPPLTAVLPFQPDRQPLGDRLRDLVFESQNVGQLAIKAFAPQMTAVARGDQLRRDPDPLADAPHTALEDVVHIQPRAGLAHVEIHPADGERRGAGDHTQPWNPGEYVDDLLGKSLTEVIVFLVAGHVDERQHCDRGLLAISARRQARLDRRFQLIGRLKPIAGVFLQAFFDEPGDLRVNVREGGRIVAQQGGEPPCLGVTSERPSACEHFVEDRTEAEDVTAAVDRAPHGLLGGHVAECPQHRALPGEGRLHRASFCLTFDHLAGGSETEVEDLYPSVRAQKDVGRFDVPVDRLPCRAPRRARWLSQRQFPSPAARAAGHVSF